MALPMFELDYGLDELENPTDVTVYATRDSERPTHWISIDIDHAVDLRDIA